jgi:hypothetical protein
VLQLRIAQHERIRIERKQLSRRGQELPAHVSVRFSSVDTASAETRRPIRRSSWDAGNFDEALFRACYARQGGIGLQRLPGYLVCTALSSRSFRRR